MGWMAIWWLLGAALIALLIWVLLQASRAPMGGLHESPEEILKRRYARGEIDSETFHRTLTDLKS